MNKFILLYNGQATDMSDMTEAQGATIMEGWKAWMGKVGEALINVGSPMTLNGTALVDDGSTRDPAPLSGYSIIQANSLEDAKALTEGHPFLSEDQGNFSVDIYELTDPPF